MLHHHQFHRSPAAGVRCPDLVSLITFGDDATVHCGLVSAFDPKLAATVDGLDRLTPGWTNTAAGLRAGVDLLSRAPRGLRRRLWLLSDGRTTHGLAGIAPTVARARKCWININTVGFGDPREFDEPALRAIAAGTHNGRFLMADTAEKLGQVFRKAAGHREGRFARGEATAFVIDASGSMFAEKMNGRQRMQVVKKAMYGLIAYKQAMWS